MDNGYDSHQAQEHIDKFKRERGLHVRHQGIIDVLKGSGWLLLGAITTSVLFYMYFYMSFYIPYAAFLLCLLIVLFGIWKCIQGVKRILGGGKIRGSLTELE